VGYYGGVNYGFGYGGIGFAGGMWRGGFFAYNTAVMHVGVGGGWGNRTYVDNAIVQRTTIINNNHVSYNGGPGGINHQPTPEERAAEHEQHTAPTAVQTQHENTFRNDHNAYAKVNGGHPQQAALARPLASANRPANNMQNHVNPQANARPANSQTNARPMDRPETVNRANSPANERPVQRSESVNRGEGNPRPSTSSPRPAEAERPAERPAARPAERPAARPESKPAPQRAAKPEKEHER
jgi:hypothetical protein